MFSIGIRVGCCQLYYKDIYLSYMTLIGLYSKVPETICYRAEISFTLDPMDFHNFKMHLHD